jgi:hypothetical protein
MDINSFNDLCNDLLTAFLDDAKVEQIVAISQNHRVKIDSKVFSKATDKVASWMETTNHDGMTKVNSKRLFQRSLAVISERFDAKLGVDFSLAPDGNLLIKDDLLQKIKNDMPPSAVAEWERSGWMKTLEQDPFKMLDNSLGVPFFANIERIAKLRISSLSIDKIPLYIGNLFGGMQNRHDWITDEYLRGLAGSVCGDRWGEVVSQDDVENDDGETGALVFDDLLLALGITERHQTEDGIPLIGRDDVLALGKVYRGEKYSMEELGEAMRRHGKK